MQEADVSYYHRLFGPSQTRAVYFGKDFLDYVVMLGLTAGLLAAVYGPLHFISLLGGAFCLFLLFTFIVRHGIEFKIPVILRRPQEIVYMLIYKIQNINRVTLMVLALLAVENLFIYFTPTWPHYTSLMRTIGLYFFYIHLALITLYRTISLFSHLKHRELAREILMQTPWKKVINEKTNMPLEIFHAYITGLLTHIVLLAPWFLVLHYVNFSVLFIPVALVANFFLHVKWMKVYNEWLYRDHWLGHNSEFEFLYLHGTHHDAIPSGMIAVAGNGILEGFFRHVMGPPLAYYNPIFAGLMYTMDVKGDIDLHQFIPGMFPGVDHEFFKTHQHSMHHFGQLAPYGFGLNFEQEGIAEELRTKFKMLPAETLNTFHLDEQLNGFKWDNKPFRNILDLFEKYKAS